MLELIREKIYIFLENNFAIKINNFGIKSNRKKSQNFTKISKKQRIEFKTIGKTQKKI